MMINPVESKHSTQNSLPDGSDKNASSSVFNTRQKEFLMLLGWFFLQNGKLGRAIDLFRVLDQVDPHDPWTMRLLSYACIKIEAYEEARGYAERFLKTAVAQSDLIIGYFLKSRALWGMGQHSEANGLMQLVIEHRKTTNA